MCVRGGRTQARPQPTTDPGLVTLAVVLGRTGRAQFPLGVEMGVPTGNQPECSLGGVVGWGFPSRVETSRERGDGGPGLCLLKWADTDMPSDRVLRTTWLRQLRRALT